MNRKEASTLALLAQKAPDVQIEVADLGLEGEALNIAEQILRPAQPDDLEATSAFREWARAARRRNDESR